MWKQIAMVNDLVMIVLVLLEKAEKLSYLTPEKKLILDIE